MPVVRLLDSAPGRVTVTRISEKLELDDESLRLVAKARLIPGATATVVERRADGMRVKTPAGEHTIPIDRRRADVRHHERRLTQRARQPPATAGTMLTVCRPGDRGVDAVQEADVLVGHEDVDEAAEPAGVVVQALGEARVRGVEPGEQLLHRSAFDRPPRTRRPRAHAAAWGCGWLP